MKLLARPPTVMMKPCSFEAAITTQEESTSHRNTASEFLIISMGTI